MELTNFFKANDEAREKRERETRELVELTNAQANKARIVALQTEELNDKINRALKK
jgi:hypothetical protein